MNDKKQSHEEGRRRYLFGENRFKYPSMPEIEVPNILYPNGLPDPLIGADMQSCDTDPNGMYTGVPAEKSDTPVQDADDLQSAPIRSSYGCLQQPLHIIYL